MQILHSVIWWHTSASTCNTIYVNMQHNYVDMQVNNVNMRNDYVEHATYW